MKVYIQERHGYWSVTVNEGNGFRETLGGLTQKEARELRKWYLTTDGILSLLDWNIILSKKRAKK